MVAIHHVKALGDSSLNCEKCAKVTDEPLRKVYFPEERRSYLLSQVLASMIGVEHEPMDGDVISAVNRGVDHKDVDGVDGDSSAHRSKKIRRS